MEFGERLENQLGDRLLRDQIGVTAHTELALSFAASRLVANVAALYEEPSE
jgi:hypothetical protein